TTTPALTVCGLRLNADAPAVDLQVHAGEIVGLGGLVGAGRTEILEAIFGLRRPASGTVEIDAIRLSASRPASAIRAGVALVPEDRKGAGLVLSRSVLDNIVLP
ncbi:ATP-binding cassette domain-containing protein, partial [Mycobacteroides abscessus]|uniref:ATP-binding cassette domain-containing protein n=1 Tax=Mycobacteroides abscessus TaxID=36809 RepID=UPI003CFAA757